MKHENHQPVGAFKVRGGVNLVACLSEKERACGVLGASTGNHGLSVAFAAQRFGVKATIFVPEGANPVKVERTRDLGAKVVTTGATSTGRGRPARLTRRRMAGATSTPVTNRC